MPKFTLEKPADGARTHTFTFPEDTQDLRLIIGGLAQHLGAKVELRQALVVETDSDRLAVEDLTFRMLAPHEIGAAMAFPDTYIVLGTNKDKVRQYGNGLSGYVHRPGYE